MTSSFSRPKAIVAGGSLGGLFAANLLTRSGWDVDVFERVPEELAGRGAGIVTHPELFRGPRGRRSSDRRLDRRQGAGASPRSNEGARHQTPARPGRAQCRCLLACPAD